MAWREALELYSQAADRELRPDDPGVMDMRARLRISGQQAGVYGWTFRPRRPETLTSALAHLPTLDQRTILTAELLAKSAEQATEVAQIAVDGLAAWLDRITREQGWMIADVLANRLASATSAPPVRQLVATMLSDGGPIGRQRAVEAEHERLLDARMTEASRRSAQSQREMARLLEEMRENQERSLTQMRDDAERHERIDRGEATDDDRAWQERLIQEAVAGADPEMPARELEVAEAERRNREKERAALQDRQRATDERSQRLIASMERHVRRGKGRATEADLAEETRLSDELLPDPDKDYDEAS